MQDSQAKRLLEPGHNYWLLRFYVFMIREELEVKPLETLTQDVNQFVDLGLVKKEKVPGHL